MPRKKQAKQEGMPLSIPTNFGRLNTEVPMPFPDRLRELRKAARMSQRALAERVGVDFTYLSKIENGRVEPPSEGVLLRIAKELASKLGKDETALADELITLAGKIPSDLAETLSRNPEVMRLLRSVGNNVRSEADWRKLFSGRSPEEQPEEG